MKSKNIFKNLVLSICLVCISLFTISCDKDEEAGVPIINKIRYTTAADGVSYANLGQTIAIIGSNLKTTKQVTFNGYPGIFKTTMLSDTSIVVFVSKDTPFLGEEATSEVVVVTEGGEVRTTLEIAPPSPEISGVFPEFAGEGGIVTISGSYFYNISEVKFGDTKAQITSNDPNSLSVIVPQGYTKGNLTVTSSKSGTSEEEIVFGLNDNEIELNWGDISPTQGAWWNSTQDGPNDDFDVLGVPYKYVESTFGNTWWTLDGGIQFDKNDNRKGNPVNKVFKFEYALIGDSPWIQFLWKTDDEYKFIVKGLPSTNGKWATYTIPMDSFTLGDGGPAMTQAIFESGDPVLMQYAFVNSGDSEITIKCAMTNFRFANK